MSNEHERIFIEIYRDCSARTVFKDGQCKCHVILGAIIFMGCQDYILVVICFPDSRISLTIALIDQIRNDIDIVKYVMENTITEKTKATECPFPLLDSDSKVLTKILSHSILRKMIQHDQAAFMKN